jgi:hypothetical protein
MKRRAAALAWALLASLPAWAQSARTVLEPPDSLACLQPGPAERGTPQYPPDLLAARQGATVKVELAFTAPDAPPSMKVTDNSGSEGFVAPLREFVARYRVPCLPAGRSTTMRQEFVFEPGEKRQVFWYDPTSEEAVALARTMSCLTHITGDRELRYPHEAWRADASGTVLVRIRFEAGDQVPRTELLSGAGHNALDAFALQHSLGYRLPCLQGTPIAFVQSFRFVLDERPKRSLLNDMELLPFLSNVKGIDKAVVYFDFRRMACPFELRFMLMQPFTVNTVGEVGDSHPERRHFIEWLKRQELNVPKRLLNRVVSESMTIAVPCGVLNLGPTTGGGASQ